MESPRGSHLKTFLSKPVLKNKKRSKKKLLTLLSFLVKNTLQVKYII